MLKNVEDCYRDGDSLRNLFVRPNQVFLTNANRADVFFKAPIDAAGKVYTVFAQEFPLATDNFQQRLQIGIASGRSGFTAGNPAPVDVVVGYIKVSGRRRCRRRLRRDEPARQAAAGAAVPPAGGGRRAAGAGGGGDAPWRAGRQLPDARRSATRATGRRIFR